MARLRPSTAYLAIYNLTQSLCWLSILAQTCKALAWSHESVWQEAGTLMSACTTLLRPFLR